MAQAHHDLGLAAVPVGTEQVRTVLHERRAAGRTDLRLLNLALALHVFVHPAHDLRDDLIRATDPHLRADLHPLALDVLPVVQRGALDRGPGQLHRGDVGQGRELAGAADLPGHVLQGRGDLLRLELVGHRPAGELVRVAQGLPGGEVRDLDDRAVDHVIQLGARGLHRVHRVDGSIQRVGVHLAAGHREAVLSQEVKHLALVGKAPALDVAHVVEAGRQLARRRDRRIQVAQRARCGVARVLQRLLGGFVVVFQRGELHERLAVHLHAALVGDAHRNRADGERLLQNLLAGHAVAAGRRTHQMTALIGQVHRQAVELVLHHVF